MSSTLLLIHNDLERAKELQKTLAEYSPGIALSIAQNTGEVRQFPAPGMILLDVDQASPCTILSWLRHTEEYRSTPVIALASATHSSSLETLYQLGANSCILKSEGGIAAEVARGIGSYLKLLKGRSHAMRLC